MNRSAVPPPVTVVMEAAEAWLPRRMGEVEARLAELAAGHGEDLARRRGATLDAGGKRLRPMLVLLCAGPDAGDGGDPRRDRDRAGPHGHPGPRRRPRRGAAAPRAPHRGRHLAARAGHGRRRPALLRAPSRSSAAVDEAPPTTRPPRAGRAAGRAPGGAARRRLGRAGPGRAGAAPRRLRPRAARRALPEPLPAEDRPPVRVRLRDRPRRPGGRRGADRRSAARSDSPSSCSTTCSTSTGPPERTGKARGTDLLDGTVTLPLIWRPRGRPGARGASTCARSTRRRRRGLRPDRGHRRAGAGPRRRAGAGRGGEEPDRARRPSSAKQRELLALVADGVVERY